MSEKVLSAASVSAVMKAVLYGPDEVKDGATKDAVIVEGLLSKFGFHPGRLKEQESKIKAMLDELPENFRKDKGGGWSFLNGAMDKNGDQWGEQRDVEALVCLGIATGHASWMLKEMMSVMPGGVPYFEVH